MCMNCDVIMMSRTHTHTQTHASFVPKYFDEGRSTWYVLVVLLVHAFINPHGFM